MLEPIVDRVGRGVDPRADRDAASEPERSGIGEIHVVVDAIERQRIAVLSGRREYRAAGERACKPVTGCIGGRGARTFVEGITGGDPEGIGGQQQPRLERFEDERGGRRG